MKKYFIMMAFLTVPVIGLAENYQHLLDYQFVHNLDDESPFQASVSQYTYFQRAVSTGKQAYGLENFYQRQSYFTFFGLQGNANAGFRQSSYGVEFAKMAERSPLFWNAGFSKSVSEYGQQDEKVTRYGMGLGYYTGRHTRLMVDYQYADSTFVGRGEQSRSYGLSTIHVFPLGAKHAVSWWANLQRHEGRDEQTLSLGADYHGRSWQTGMGVVTTAKTWTVDALRHSPATILHVSTDITDGVRVGLSYTYQENTFAANRRYLSAGIGLRI